MKKIIFFVAILSIFTSTSAGASEIFGQISTNPNAPSGGPNNPPREEPAANPPTSVEPVINRSSGAVILPVGNRQIVESEAEEITLAKPEVLGEKIYPDGTLARLNNHKIYLIRGQTKKHITNLKELEKYPGRAIIEASAEDLAGYQTRSHISGELIRQQGQAKVFAITSAGKHHILNLAELRANYFGLEIFNISSQEMSLY